MSEIKVVGFLQHDFGDSMRVSVSSGDLITITGTDTCTLYSEPQAALYEVIAELPGAIQESDIPISDKFRAALDAYQSKVR